MNGLKQMVGTAIAKEENEEFKHPTPEVIATLKTMLLETRYKAMKERKNYYGYNVDGKIVFSLANKELDSIITVRVNGIIKFNINQYEIYDLVEVKEKEVKE